LLNHSAIGVYRLAEGGDREEQSMAVFDFALDFQIFEDSWTAIPLIEAGAIVTDWEILKAGAPADTASPSRFRPASLGPELLLTLRPEEGDTLSEE